MSFLRKQIRFFYQILLNFNKIYTCSREKESLKSLIKNLIPFGKKLVFGPLFLAIYASSKLKKVELIISENEKKYLPILEKIDIQLNQLKKEKEKLGGDANSTKTRQL